MVSGRFFGGDSPGELVNSVFMVITICSAQMVCLAFFEGVFLRGIMKIIKKMNNKSPGHATIFASLEVDKKHNLPLIGDG